MERYNLSPDGATPSFTDLAGIEPETALQAAIEYRRRGFNVTPLNGKEAILPDWPTKELGEEELPHHFGSGRNVGIVLGGASGVVDIDLDNALAVVVANYLLPDTVRSGREKSPFSHWLYICDPLPKSKTYALPKRMAEQLMLDPGDATLVELRSTGRQTVVAPSLHPEDGDRYVWHPGEICVIDGKELEGLVLDVAIATLLALQWPDGSRQRFVLCAAGYLGRHLEHRRVEAILQAAAAAAEDEEQPKRAGAVRDTLEKLSDGQEAVTGGRVLEELAPGVAAQIAGWCGWQSMGGEREGDTNGPRGDRKAPTHDTLRDRWLENQEAPTAYGQSEWRRYQDGYWASVHEQVVCAEIDEILTAAKAEKIKPTSGIRASVERMARAKAFVPDEAWDANEDILVCANGTLQISSGILREHRPEDFALSAVPFDYDPEAEAPTWRDFLASTVPEAAPFLQEFSGYSLTVDTSHELAAWLHGPPGGGKSTFIEGLKAMLGKRAGLLGLADVQRSRFALADLPGKTLVVAAEQPSDFIHSTQLINNIISGEEIPVERKFRDAFTVTPRAKICWAMNDLPRVKDANSGLFRRVKIVAFPKLRSKPDPEVKERIKAEGAGILVWALKGLHRLRERGRFEIPNSVRAATQEFKQSNDVPGTFIEEACITSDAPDCEEQAMDLYRAYHHWCRISGHHPLSSTKVASEWRRLGFGSRSLNGKKIYTGVRVDPSWIAAQEDYPKI